MQFENALRIYFKTIPTMTTIQSDLIIEAIRTFKIPLYSVLVGLQYFDVCFLNQSTNNYLKLCSALFLGYKNFEDHYYNVKYWCVLTGTPSSSIVRYEIRMLKKLDYHIHVSRNTIEYILHKIETAVDLPMTPDSQPLFPQKLLLAQNIKQYPLLD